MAKKKKIKAPYRDENVHHLLFGDESCCDPSIVSLSLEEINDAIADWQLVVDIECENLKDEYDESSAFFLKQARKEIQILKLQKREILATAI